MSQKEKCIEEFVKFTCSTEMEAKSYLENSGWNTEAALVMYFDDRDDRVDPSTLGNTAPTVAATDRDSEENDSMHGEDEIYSPPHSFDFTSSPERRSNKTETPKTFKPVSNIATLASMRRTEDEEDDEDQLYYAGGSEHSGQQIMGNDRSDRHGDVAGEVFKSLKQMVTVGEVELAGPSREGQKRFSGVGYRLGQTPDDTEVVGSSRKPEDSRPELHLRLWRDGFSIGDEPLRPYSDPENRETIEMLLRGEVPMHLVPPGTKGAKVSVKVEDARHERYTGPVSGGNYFTGAGHVLGNVVPEIVRNDAPKPSEAKPSEKPAVEAPKSPIEVNENEPTTNIAVRLPNGARSQVRLNLTHSVEDLRRHLLALNRELEGQSFVFMVSFPPKEVPDEKLSIAEAGLVNSSVHLRIKN